MDTLNTGTITETIKQRVTEPIGGRIPHELRVAVIAGTHAAKEAYKRERKPTRMRRRLTKVAQISIPALMVLDLIRLARRMRNGDR